MSANPFLKYCELLANISGRHNQLENNKRRLVNYVKFANIFMHLRVIWAIELVSMPALGHNGDRHPIRFKDLFSSKWSLSKLFVATTETKSEFNGQECPRVSSGYFLKLVIQTKERLVRWLHQPPLKHWVKESQRCGQIGHELLRQQIKTLNKREEGAHDVRIEPVPAV